MLLLIIQLLCILVSESFSHDLPSYFPRCALDDRGLNVCIGRAANILRPYIKRGIEEIKFPSLDPLFISNLEVTQESNLVNYTCTVWNYTTRGLDNYDLTYIRYDPKTLTFNGTIEFDSLSFHALYVVDGRLLSIPIQGNGDVNINFGETNGTFEIVGKIVKRKGIEYYKPITTTFRMLVGDSSYHLNGLFDGNEQIESFTNDMINRNAQMITEAVVPALEKLAEKGIMYLMKSLTHAVPYDELFSTSQNQEKVATI